MKKQYIVGKIVEENGEMQLDGVTVNKGVSLLGAGVFITGLVTIFTKGKNLCKKVTTKFHLNEKVEKIKTKINLD